MQGVFGMLWGGSKRANRLDRKRKRAGWVSPGPAAKAWVESAAGSTLRSALAMKKRRADQDDGLEFDQVWIGPPPKARFPDTLTLNGTTYEDQGWLDGMYTDSVGRVVNLTSLFVG